MNLVSVMFLGVTTCSMLNFLSHFRQNFCLQVVKLEYLTQTMIKTSHSIAVAQKEPCLWAEPRSIHIAP